MGLITPARVITSREAYSRPKLIQSDNHEWITAIECVSVAGFALSLYIIFKAKNLQETWFDLLPSNMNWRLDKSDNRWTTDEIEIKWLTKHFIPETTKH